MTARRANTRRIIARVVFGIVAYFGWVAMIVSAYDRNVPIALLALTIASIATWRWAALGDVERYESTHRNGRW